MKRSIFLASAALALLVAGCGDEKKDAPAGGPSGTAAAQKPTTTAAARPAPTAQAVAANDDIPSEVDFEDEAEKDITADSVESELDKLEKELAQ